MLTIPASAQLVPQCLRAFGSATQSGSTPETALVFGKDGALYGLTSSGGANGCGSVFKLNVDGSGHLVIHSFTVTDGRSPIGLIQARNGVLYGTTKFGGSSDYGTVFRVNPDGTGFATIHTFDPTDAAFPYAGVIEGADGVLYGTTYQGGAAGWGTVFKLNPDGSGYSILYNFNFIEGGGGYGAAYPIAALTQGRDGALYGTTSKGGTNNYGANGAVFKVNVDGSGYAVLHYFNGVDGQVPEAGLIQGTDGALYGTTAAGGSIPAAQCNYGTIFKINPDGTGFARISYSCQFTVGGVGMHYQAVFVQSTPGILFGTSYAGGTNDLGTVFSINTNGLGYTLLHTFTGTSDGQNPSAGLVLGTNGVLYGTTSSGGAAGAGTVFKVNTDGSAYGILHNFSISGGDAATPEPGLVQGINGTLYGIGSSGWTNGSGAVFRINADGSDYALLHAFGDTQNDGRTPVGGLTLAQDGKLYGTTFMGGDSNLGTVYRIGVDANDYAIIHSFNGADGQNPRAGLLQATDGVLYGTTYAGGAYGAGIVFRINTDGSGYTILHSFDPRGIWGIYDGIYPTTGLIQGSDGALYGTTSQLAQLLAYKGTVFTIRPSGSNYIILHWLYSNGGEGMFPNSLVQGNDGWLYGTTQTGGTNSSGILFKLGCTNGSSFSVLSSFGGTNGVLSHAGLSKGTDGGLYGTISGLNLNSAQGLLFRMNTNGPTYTIVSPFPVSSQNGLSSISALFQGNDGLWYGATPSGGDMACGTVFRLVPVPRIIAGNWVPSYGFGVTVVGAPGLLYRVDASTDLVNWGPTHTNIMNASGEIQFVDLSATNTQRFYRAAWVP